MLLQSTDRPGPRYVDAGDNFGITLAEIVPVEKMQSFVRNNFVLPLLKTRGENEQLNILEEGCGLGSFSIAVAVYLAQQRRGRVFASFNDPQPKNISEVVRRTDPIMSGGVILPPNLDLAIPMEEDISAFSLPGPIHGAILNNFLHFVPVEKTEQFLEKLSAVMAIDGGLTYINVATPFNCACIGTGAEQVGKHEEVVAELASGRDLPIERFNGLYKRQMVFFTPQAITKLLEKYGFKVTHLELFRNTAFPNGRRDDAENLRLVAQRFKSAETGSNEIKKPAPVAIDETDLLFDH